MPPDDTKPGIALADRLREENERERLKEQKLAERADAKLEELEDFATTLGREVRRLERANWEPSSVRVDLGIKAEPAHAPAAKPPCDDDQTSLPVLRVVPVSYRKYAVGALLMAALLGLVGQDKVKALIAVLFGDTPSAEAEDARKKKPPEDSGSDAAE